MPRKKTSGSGTVDEKLGISTDEPVTGKTVPLDTEIKSEDLIGRPLLVRFRPLARDRSLRRGDPNPYIFPQLVEVIEQSSGRDLSQYVRRIVLDFDADTDMPLEVELTLFIEADIAFRAVVLPLDITDELPFEYSGEEDARKDRKEERSEAS
jgi:hypothetical protein